MRPRPPAARTSHPASPIARSARRRKEKSPWPTRPAMLYSRRWPSPLGRRLPMLRALARRLAVSAAAAPPPPRRPAALHRWLGRGRRQLLRRRERHLRVRQPRAPRRPALQPGGDAGLALQPRGAARPAARLRPGAIRLAEGRLRGERRFAASRSDDRPAQRDVALSRGAHRPRPPRAGIARIADLVGKRVDIGPPASGRRATVMRHPRPRSKSTATTSRAVLSCPPAARSTSSAPAGSTRRS